MKLYVMRHGPAEEDTESGSDSDRALSVEGRRCVLNVAEALLEAGEEPLEVLTSPLVRTVQTAEVVAIVTKLGDRRGTVRTRRELAPSGNSAPLARRFAAGGRRRTMFVGHEPDLSALVSALLGVQLGRPFEKAMVVGLHVPPDGGPCRLRFVLEPKTLQLETGR
jgi:phosphohistidine phosphatase